MAGDAEGVAGFIMHARTDIEVVAAPGATLLLLLRGLQSHLPLLLSLSSARSSTPADSELGLDCPLASRYYWY